MVPNAIGVEVIPGVPGIPVPIPGVPFAPGVPDVIPPIPAAVAVSVPERMVATAVCVALNIS